LVSVRTEMTPVLRIFLVFAFDLLMINLLRETVPYSSLQTHLLLFRHQGANKERWLLQIYIHPIFLLCQQDEDP
jgi:hypothetical protein